MTGRMPSSAHDVEAAAEARAVLSNSHPAPVVEVLGAVHRGLAGVLSDRDTGAHSPLPPADPTRLAIRRRTGL